MKKFDISNIIVTKICDVYSYSLPRDTEGSAVCAHSTLLFKKKGVSEYTVEKNTYTVDSENALFLPSGTDYSMYVRSAGECIIIEFDCAESDVAAQVCPFPLGDDGEISAVAKNILHYWKLKGPAYHSKCLSELYTFITMLSNSNSYTNSLAGKYRMIHRSVKYIEANYRRVDLYTPDLAKMSGMGETYYRSIFLSVFSVAPTKYIQNYRVEKSKELLVNSDAPIEDIATAVGFANASYFCKVFKSTTGLTPTEFSAKSKKLG
jgi:AraC-like DNA-binding protein